MPRKRRTFSIDFKKEVVAEYLGGETLHRFARRHRIDPGLLRIWVEKAEAGEFDSEAASAELVSAYERRIGALERLVGRQAVEIEFLRGGFARETLAAKRAYIRDQRPCGLSVKRRCELMGVPRSSFTPRRRRSPEDPILAELRAITEAFPCYGYRRVDAGLRHRGRVVNAKKIRRLMKENELNP